MGTKIDDQFNASGDESDSQPSVGNLLTHELNYNFQTLLEEVGEIKTMKIEDN